MALYKFRIIISSLMISDLVDNHSYGEL